MLVLTRKLDEDIVIGDNIRIRILKVKGNTIRIGIDAPRDVKVLRGELDCPEIEFVDHDQPQDTSDCEAEVTVVFGNAGGKASNTVADRRDCSFSQPGGLVILPFANRNNSQDSPTNSNSRTNSNPETIRFREPLPQSLHHNRLKEIVKGLVRKN